MASKKPNIVVTGVSGNLGRRLLGQMTGWNVIGVDFHEPLTPHEVMIEFHALDMGQESSCNRLVEVFAETKPVAVVHLAFVIDPLQTGVLDFERMWQINVAGTARVMEAIAEHNRLGRNVLGDSPDGIKRFLHMSSVSAYGPDLDGAVTEDHPLGAHTLPYAIHKQESDEVVQKRAASLGDCITYILRPHIFVGRTMQNYLVGALRGTPTGTGKIGKWLRKRGTRLPMLLPIGQHFLEKKFQFVHVDDMARLIDYIVNQGAERKGPRTEIINVAGRGDSLTLAECARISNAKLIRLPGSWMCRIVLQWLWHMGISGIPAESLPYMTGSYTMDTARLRVFLGDDYRKVMHFTIQDALEDCFDVPTENILTPKSNLDTQEPITS